MSVNQEPEIPITTSAAGALACPYGRNCQLRWADEKKLRATCDFGDAEPCAETIPFNGALICGAILQEKKAKKDQS